VHENKEREKEKGVTRGNDGNDDDGAKNLEVSDSLMRLPRSNITL